MNLIDDRILDNNKTLDDFIKVFGGDDNFKHRLEMFKATLGRYNLSPKEILWLYTNQDIIREIYAWDGHYRLMACLEYEIRKNEHRKRDTGTY